jgi:hypothetical protein
MKRLLFFLCVFYSFSLSAQQIKLGFSQEVKFEDDVVSFHKYGKFFYSDKVDHIREEIFRSATLKRMKNAIEFTQYDENLKEIKTLSLDNNDKNLGPFPPVVHYANSFIYVVYFKYMADETVKMYVAKINPEDLSLVGTKELLEYNKKTQGIWTTFKVLRETHILFTMSADEKKIWIVHASPTLFNNIVIDADLNILQAADALPVKMKAIGITDTYLSNSGDKLLLYHYNSPDPDLIGQGVFFHTAGKSPVFQDVVNFPKGFYPFRLRMIAASDDKIYYGTHYFPVGKDDKGQNGVAFGEIDLSANVIKAPSLYPYSDDLKQKIRDVNFAAKSKGKIVFVNENLNYWLNELEDGTIVLSADMESVDLTPNKAYYYRGPIIHVFVKPGGQATMALVAKSQTSDASTDFIVTACKDKLVCIYGDYPEGSKKIVPVANVYSSDGALLSRQFLMDVKQLQRKIMIEHRSELNHNRFLIPVGETRVNLSRYFTRIRQLAYLDIF